MSSYRTAFISHAHFDNARCERIYRALLARGVNAWIDLSNAQKGHDLGEEIALQLRERQAFVLMVTTASNASHWVLQEWGAYNFLKNSPATHMLHGVERMILPVRLNDEVPTLLGGIFWIEGVGKTDEQIADEIAAALVLVGPPPPPPPPPPLETPGPAPTPQGAKPAPYLTPMALYNLDFRGYEVKGIELILPPLCFVAAGVFEMGSDKTRDPQAYDDETPPYPIEVASFRIGQHPVTVAEYACAVRAKAVREPPDSSSMTWAKQQTQPTHPVVCINWQDATAYARWLASAANQPWRLPSEAHWEKAARWDPKANTGRGVSRLYPWEGGFDKARCNTSEGGVGTTTPVGRYPSGASPCGAQDMAGNVREWTSSRYKPYPYRENDGREDANSTESRTLRGGSWNDASGDARAAYRDNDRPDDWYGYRGFRLLFAAAGS
ncbi:MAG: SUMF1/EgtB/PvdO family nonheme iron enzyme, partial [Ktedonobacterales bacterium]